MVVKYLDSWYVGDPQTTQRRKLQSTENFIDAIKTVQIRDDYKLVSFDVKSLFTSIPLQLALQCTETAIQQSTVKLPLPTEDIMDLLNLCLTSTYFQYNGKHYKQLHGTAMGSPVSVVIAEIVMQHVEERALATCRQTINCRRMTRRLSVKRPTTKNIMQRTESESWPSKNDIVQRTSRFSKPVEKDGMKLTRNDLPVAREPIVNRTRSTSEITGDITQGTDQRILEKLLCQE